MQNARVSSESWTADGSWSPLVWFAVSESEIEAQRKSDDPESRKAADQELRRASKRSLIVTLILTSVFMVVEVVGGIMSGSLALLAGAGHLLTDSGFFGLALFAIWIAEKPASVKRTFGYKRVEILAAAGNALSLWLITILILWESIDRIINPHHVEGHVVLIVGIAGVLLHLVGVYILRGSSKQSLNVQGALQHVIAHLMTMLAVVVSGAAEVFFEWEVVDPILSALIAVLILFSSWEFVKSVLTVLIEGTPEHIDVYKLCSDLEDVPGVTVIHDVHVWTVTSGYVSLTAHLLIDPNRVGEFDQILHQLRQIAKEDYGIAHSTIQLETSARDCDEDHHVDHLLERESTRKRRRFSFAHHH